MKVGEYVRTEDGYIGKIESIEKNERMHLYQDTIYTDNWRNLSSLLEEAVFKSSPNIIDLIERFDLVNGHLVICKMYENEKDIPTIVKCVGNYYFKEEDIKSIVTKEQFSQIEYRIGE